MRRATPGCWQIKVDLDLYVSGAFGLVYEQVARQTGARPSCRITPREPGKHHVIVHTTEPDAIRAIIRTAEQRRAQCRAIAHGLLEVTS